MGRLASFALVGLGCMFGDTNRGPGGSKALGSVYLSPKWVAEKCDRKCHKSPFNPVFLRAFLKANSWTHWMLRDTDVLGLYRISLTSVSWAYFGFGCHCYSVFSDQSPASALIGALCRGRFQLGYRNSESQFINQSQFQFLQVFIERLKNASREIKPLRLGPIPKLGVPLIRIL